MLRTALALTLVVGFVPPSLPAADSRFAIFPSDPQLNRFIQTYHSAPDPDAAIDRFFAIDFDKLERTVGNQEFPHMRAILMAFFGCILRDNPSHILPFARRLTSGTKGEQAAFGTELVAYSGTPARDEALSVIAKGFGLPGAERAKFRALRPFDYSSLEATDGQMLDNLWACYFATGESAYLAKIAAPLGSTASTRDESFEEMKRLAAGKPKPGSSTYARVLAIATGEAARLGLSSVAREDEKALAVLRQLIGRVPEKVGSRLRSIVEANGRTGGNP